jgi:hypothetical protein
MCVDELRFVNTVGAVDIGAWHCAGRVLRTLDVSAMEVQS